MDIKKTAFKIVYKKEDVKHPLFTCVPSNLPASLIINILERLLFKRFCIPKQILPKT